MVSISSAGWLLSLTSISPNLVPSITQRKRKEGRANVRRNPSKDNLLLSRRPQSIAELHGIPSIHLTRSLHNLGALRNLPDFLGKRAICAGGGGSGDDGGKGEERTKSSVGEVKIAILGGGFIADNRDQADLDVNDNEDSLGLVEADISITALLSGEHWEERLVRFSEGGSGIRGLPEVIAIIIIKMEGRMPENFIAEKSDEGSDERSGGPGGMKGACGKEREIAEVRTPSLYLRDCAECVQQTTCTSQRCYGSDWDSLGSPPNVT